MNETAVERRLGHFLSLCWLYDSTEREIVVIPPETPLWPVICTDCSYIIISRKDLFNTVLYMSR